MLKNRKLTVMVDKRPKDQTAGEQLSETLAFERKASAMVHQIERVGKKVFLGICFYVVLDTARQVAVARELSS